MVVRSGRTMAATRRRRQARPEPRTAVAHRSATRPSAGSLERDSSRSRPPRPRSRDSVGRYATGYSSIVALGQVFTTARLRRRSGPGADDCGTALDPQDESLLAVPSSARRPKLCANRRRMKIGRKENQSSGFAGSRRTGGCKLRPKWKLASKRLDWATLSLESWSQFPAGI